MLLWCHQIYKKIFLQNCGITSEASAISPVHSYEQISMYHTTKALLYCVFLDIEPSVIITLSLTFQKLCIERIYLVYRRLFWSTELLYCLTAQSIHRTIRIASVESFHCLLFCCANEKKRRKFSTICKTNMALIRRKTHAVSRAD